MLCNMILDCFVTWVLAVIIERNANEPFLQNTIGMGNRVEKNYLLTIV